MSFVSSILVVEDIARSRVHDYDNHVIEVAERMEVVISQLQQAGHSTEEIAKFTGYSVDQVLHEIEALQEQRRHVY